MIRVLHLLDGGCDETALQRLAVLRRRAGTDGPIDLIASVDGPTARRAQRFLGEDVVRAEQRRFWRMALSAKLMDADGWAEPVVVHAWGLDAAQAAGGHLPDVPLVITLLNPETTANAAAVVRAIPQEAAVVAGNQVIRARLAAAGVDPDRMVVVRGPADFAAINTARRQGLRKRMVGDARPVVLLHGPASRGGGQYYGIWAAAIVAQVHRNLRVLLPYESREADRLERFCREIRMPELLIRPGRLVFQSRDRKGAVNTAALPPEAVAFQSRDRKGGGSGVQSPAATINETDACSEGDMSLTWPRLAACADVFCCPAVEDVCTEPLSAAMAAGLPVVGCAVRSVAEIIADRHNGLLCKPRDPRALAGRLLTAIEDADLRRRVSEVARGHAYEVFGIRQFVDNHARLYENVLSGRTPGDGVHDTATAPAW